MRKRRLVLSGLILVALAGLYTFYWFWMAQRLELVLRAWREAGGLGPEVTASFENGRIEGFPFRFAAPLRDAALTWRRPQGTIKVAGPAVRLEMPPWNWRHFRLFAGQPVAIASDLGGNGRLVPLAEAGTLDLSLDLASGRIDRIAATAGDAALHLEPARSLRAKAATLKLALPATPAKDYHDEAAAISLRLADVTMPGHRLGFAAGPIERLALDVTLMGPLSEEAPLERALAAWRDSGGTLEVTEFSFAQAPLDLHGNGTLALDKDLQPTGALTVTARGLRRTIEAMRAEDLVSARDAAAGLMAARAFEKADGEIAAGVSLQDGRIWLGPLPLAPLPRIDWNVRE